MTRTDYRRERTDEGPGYARIPLGDRRDTKGEPPSDDYAPDPDSDYEARYETASDGMEMDR